MEAEGRERPITTANVSKKEEINEKYVLVGFYLPFYNVLKKKTDKCGIEMKVINKKLVFFTQNLSVW